MLAIKWDNTPDLVVYLLDAWRHEQQQVHSESTWRSTVRYNGTGTVRTRRLPVAYRTVQYSTVEVS